MITIDPKYLNEMVQLRRDLHAHPETGWTEFRTTAIVAERLRALGLQVSLGLDIINPQFVMGRDEAEVEAAQARALKEGVSPEALAQMQGYTGVMGVLDTGRLGPVTAFRFDLDALAVTETDSPDHIPNLCDFASQHPGLMHACGHDCHTALGVALAHWAADHVNLLTGVVKFIFQPAEEGTRGALAMAEKGIVDDVDNFIASHIACKPRLGEITITDPGFNATYKVDVTFTGKPAHSVSNPQDGRNALMAACHTVTMIGSLPRHGDGLTAIVCGRLVAGETRNVVPVHALLQMEVRGATDKLCEYAYLQLSRVVEAQSGAFDVSYGMRQMGKAITMNPSPKLAAIVEDCAKDVVGVDKVSHYSEKGASEDASILIARVQQHGGLAAHFCYGADHTGNHSCDFDPDDIQSMPIGFEVYLNISICKAFIGFNSKTIHITTHKAKGRSF